MSNKTSLLGGFVLGVLVTIVISGSVYLVYRYQQIREIEKTPMEQFAESGDAALYDEVMTDEAETKLEYINYLIQQYYLEDTDHEAMLDGIYAGLVGSLGDPYSAYYDAEQTSALEESLTGTYGGIGATLQQDTATGTILIVNCFEDSPAVEGGLLPGDRIVKVDGRDIAGMELSAAVALIKGEENTDVVLTVYREGESDYLDLTLVRKIIDIPTVAYEMLEEQIGYIQLSSFDGSSAEQFEDALSDLNAQGMQGLIVDLRSNPGGVMTAACEISDLFIEDGLIVYTEDKYGARNEYWAQDKDGLNLPMAVLVDGNSASASEIMAGALQDHDKATIVGTQTYGKGIVQQVLSLGDETSVKLTFSTYFTPEGNDIHGVGITPDVEVELDEELLTQAVITREDDNQLAEAVRIVTEQLAQ